MKTIYSSLVCLCLLFNISMLSAQSDIQDFTITSQELSVHDKTLTTPSTITKTGDLLSWTQGASGTGTPITFQILETSGDWDSSTNQGELTYSLSLGGSLCEFKLLSNQQGLIAKLSFMESSNDQSFYQITVDTLTYL